MRLRHAESMPPAWREGQARAVPLCATSQGDTMSALSLEAIVAAKGSARPHFRQAPGLFVPSGTSVNSTWGRSDAGRAVAARTLPLSRHCHGFGIIWPKLTLS